MGAKDYVRLALEAHGQIEFWKVNVRPGKPLVFGSYAGTPFLGLPGNPVSALVTFEVFVRPALDRLSGQKGTQRRKVLVRLDQSLPSDGRESYLRVTIRWEKGEHWASLTGSQDSGVLSSLVDANGLLLVPAGVKRLDAGQVLEAWLF